MLSGNLCVLKVVQHSQYISGRTVVLSRSYTMCRVWINSDLSLPNYTLNRMFTYLEGRSLQMQVISYPTTFDRTYNNCRSSADASATLSKARGGFCSLHLLPCGTFATATAECRFVTTSCGSPDLFWCPQNGPFWDVIRQVSVHIWLE